MERKTPVHFLVSENGKDVWIVSKKDSRLHIDLVERNGKKWNRDEDRREYWLKRDDGILAVFVDPLPRGYPGFLLYNSDIRAYVGIDQPKALYLYRLKK